MKTFIIHLSLIPQSASMARDVFNSLKKFGVDAEMFEGTYGHEATSLFEKENRTVHKIFYQGKEIAGFEDKSGHKGCFHSHYRLWQKCCELNEPIMIFEDDVRIYRGYVPVEFEEVLILSVGTEWKLSNRYINLLEENQDTATPLSFLGECMMGTSGYAITPKAAKKLLDTYKKSWSAVDHSMNRAVVKLEIHNKLMGKSIPPTESNKSLTKNYNFTI